MRRRPMLFLACVFAQSILYALQQNMIFVAGILATIAYEGGPLFLLLVQERKEKTVSTNTKLRLCIYLLLACICIPVGITHTQAVVQEQKELLAKIREGMDITLQGKITKKESKNEQFLYYLADSKTIISDEIIPCGTVLIYQKSDTYSIGETLIVSGQLHMFETASNEGAFDAAQFYYCQGIYFCLYEPQIREVRRNSGLFGWISAVEENLYRIRRKIQQVFLSCMEEKYAGILSTMLLGEKSALDVAQKKQYQSVGISHILAISGLHVTLIGMCLYRFLRKRGWHFLAAFCLAGTLVILYACMTGNSISAKRAVGMLLLSMFADFVGRSYDSLNALGTVCMVLLWQNPRCILYSGFQFSVMAVLGVVVLGKCILMMFDSFGLAVADTPLGKSCITSASIWMFTLPLVAWNYYEIPVYGILLNVMVLPLVKYIFVFGALGGCLGLFCFYGAGEWLLSFVWILLRPCEWLLKLYDVLIAVCLKLPKARWLVGRPCMMRMLFYYGILFLFCLIVWRQRKREEGLTLQTASFATNNCLKEKEVLRGRRKRQTLQLGHRKKSWKIRGTGWLLLALLLLFAPQKHPFEIDVLDVGQGDGVYLCTGDGTNLFIDGGSSDVKHVGEYRILPFLKCRGISSIDYWLVSHADDDHISGLCEVLESGYRIRFLVIAKVALSDEKVQNLILLAKQNGTALIPVTAGDCLQWNTSKLQFLSPRLSEVSAASAKTSETLAMTAISATIATPKSVASADLSESTYDRNENSLVCLFSYEDFRCMFAGDISTETEAALVSRYAKNDGLDVDFYKVNHHGSKYSSSDAWLTALHPEISVISCGSNNLYGHPHDETILRLKGVDSAVYRTDELGQIRIYFDKAGIVRCERGTGERK